MQTPTAFIKVKEGWKQKIPYFLQNKRRDTHPSSRQHIRSSTSEYSPCEDFFQRERQYANAANYLNVVDRLLKSMGKHVGTEIVDCLISIAEFSKVNKDNFSDAVALRLHTAAMVERLIDLDQAEAPYNKMEIGGLYELYQSRIKADYELYRPWVCTPFLSLSQEEKNTLFRP